MCPQRACDLIQYLNALSWGGGIDVPSGSTWSCPVFKWTLLTLWRQCVLSEYVILLSVWMNSTNIVVSMCPQQVCDVVQYLKWTHWCSGIHVPSVGTWSCPVSTMNSTDVVVSMCPQQVCDLIQYLNELHWCCGIDVLSGSMWFCPVFEWIPLILWCWPAISEYVMLSSIWTNSADVVVSMCPQKVRDLVGYLNTLHWCCSVRVPSASTWSHWVFECIANVVTFMGLKDVLYIVQYLNELWWHGVNLSSGCM